MKKIKISKANKKHLKIIAYLVGTWILALGLAYSVKDMRLVGLAPVFNYIGFILEKELSGEGYSRSVK